MALPLLPKNGVCWKEACMYYGRPQTNETGTCTGCNKRLDPIGSKPLERDHERG